MRFLEVIEVLDGFSFHSVLQGFQQYRAAHQINANAAFVFRSRTFCRKQLKALTDFPVNGEFGPQRPFHLGKLGPGKKKL